ncbi:kinase-like domain-containing protein [Jimgerdemannia flammicorona]|uniref:Kinase-like domain-containing protein n=1 Tax=Jimgerdemannia flammicorona TaxID=994334 RepID=A0A433D0B6_9FUNG|nr:kinase-like domain-containing protein [Jimgerdemannia flammicorona]
MSHQVPINLALRLLPHFDDLPREYWSNVFRLKRQFPYDSELKKNLKQLNPKLVALVRYLVWIPYNCFVKIEQVGQGDFTNVWKGTISNYMSEGGNAHDECFALKEIDESLVQEAMVYTIIANSVNIMGLTKHPKSGKYFVITEFLEGGSLEDRLSQHALDNWVNIFEQAFELCLNLAHLHDFGLIHYDLHPGNIAFRAAEIFTSTPTRLVQPPFPKLSVSQSQGTRRTTDG